MSAIAGNRALSPVRDSVNGSRPKHLERGELSATEIEQLIEDTARKLLQTDAADAYRMLDAGMLDGTLAGESLRSLRWLLTAGS